MSNNAFTIKTPDQLMRDVDSRFQQTLTEILAKIKREVEAGYVGHTMIFALDYSEAELKSFTPAINEKLKPYNWRFYLISGHSDYREGSYCQVQISALNEAPTAKEVHDYYNK